MFTANNEDLNKMSKDEVLEQLKKHVSIRDEMGGVLYWNILNDKCCNIANKCLELGFNKKDIAKLLGEGNFR